MVFNVIFSYPIVYKIYTRIIINAILYLTGFYNDVIVRLFSSSSSLEFIGGWQTSLKVHYRHQLDWSVEQEFMQKINNIKKITIIIIK